MAHQGDRLAPEHVGEAAIVSAVAQKQEAATLGPVLPGLCGAPGHLAQLRAAHQVDRLVPEHVGVAAIVSAVAQKQETATLGPVLPGLYGARGHLAQLRVVAVFNPGPECVLVVLAVWVQQRKLEAAVSNALNGDPGESGMLVLHPVALEPKQEAECVVVT